MNHVANFIAQINMAVARRLVSITVRGTRLIVSILKLLVRLGYVRGFNVIGPLPGKTISCSNNQFIKICVFFKYSSVITPSLRGLSIISSPSSRLYVPYNKLCNSSKQRTNAGLYKTVLLSTSSIGLCTLEECIRIKSGGEPLVLVH